MRIHLRVVPALVVLGLVGAACGGGGSKTSPLSGIPAPSKDPKIAAEVPQNIAAKGTLIVATDASYAPMEFFAPDNKTVEGADVDLGTAIGDVLGLKFKFVNATFSTIIPGLQSGKFDLGMSSFFDTKEREGVVDMVDYFHAGSGIIVKATNNNSYNSLDQFCGQAVAAETGTTQADDIAAASKTCQSQGKPAIKALSFDDQNGVNLAVNSGRAVAGLADSEVCDYQVKVTNAQFRVAGQYAAPVLYGLAIPRPTGAFAGSGPLTKAIADALSKLMTDGTYTKILVKWGIQRWGIGQATTNAATS
jgi:polar amino acid transport system substrate-binding protein